MTAIIILDPGHGGEDPGTTRGTFEEKGYVLRIALMTRAALLAKGWPIEVELTRDEDRGLSLRQRGALAAAYGADLVLSLHVNSSSEEKHSGMIAFARSGDPLGESVAAHVTRSAPLELLRTRNAFFRCDPLLVRTDPARAWLSRVSHVLERFAGIPACLIEIAHLSNQRDREEMTRPEVQAGVVAALATGVDHYLSLTGARGIAARGGRPMLA